MMKQAVVKQNIKRSMQILLSAILVVGLMPAIGHQLKTESYATGTQPNATLLFASDYQEEPGFSDPSVNFQAIATRVAESETIDEVIFAGDYTNSSGLYNYNADASADIAEIKSIVSNTFGPSTETSFIQGNHDIYNSSLMEADGPVYNPNYIVYYMNTQSANPWSQGTGGGTSATVQKTANNLKMFFDERIAAGDTRPIFVVTHVPLHMSSRTTSLYGSGDNMYSSYIFNVVNDAAETLDIVYLFGHNHSHGWDSYLGGSCVYKPVGSVLPIPDCTNATGTTNKYTNETLKFTYMNAGYVGYNTGTNGDSTLTSSVVRIYPDKLEIKRYFEYGEYSVVGAAGAYNTLADGGTRNDANGFENGSGPYALATETASPVTISLKNTNNGLNPDPTPVVPDTMGKWTLVQSAEDLEPGRYMLAYSNGAIVQTAIAQDTSGQRTGLITVSENSLTGVGQESVEVTDDTHAWTLEQVDSGWLLKSANGYLALETSNNCPASWVSNATDATIFQVTPQANGTVQLTYNNGNHCMQLSVDRERVYGYATNNSKTKDFYLYKEPQTPVVNPGTGNGSESTDVSVRIRNGQYDITDVLQRRYEVGANTSETLTAVPTGFTNPTITWTTSNSSVLTVNNNGVINFTGAAGYARVNVTVSETINGQAVKASSGVTYYVSDTAKPEATENYPEYPNEGSVRINKTATGVSFDETGVARVELSADGVSAVKPIDVVVVVDMSSSMKDSVGGATRVQIANDSLEQLVTDILAPHADGTANQNRVSIVAFNNYDYININSSTSSPNGNLIGNYSTGSSEIATGFNFHGGTNPVLTGSQQITDAFNSASELDQVLARIDANITYDNCSSGTNYDLGLMTAYKVLAAAKAEPNYNREQVVVFMSDGSPYQYNYYRGYSGNGDAGKGEAWIKWVQAGKEYSALDAEISIGADNYGRVFYSQTGTNYWQDAIVGTGSKSVIDPYSGANSISLKGANQNPESYLAQVDGLGAKMYAVGFCLADDAELKVENQQAMLTNRVASDPSLAFFASDASELNNAFKSIADSLAYAATDCSVSDLMGSAYKMQMASTIKHGTSTVNLADSAYIGQAPYLEIGKWTLDDARHRVSGSYQSVEKITFKTDSKGNLTAAYSSLTGSTNIYDASTGWITGTYTSYNVNTEELKANVAYIPGNTQYTINYFVYLEGSLEGTRDKGIYPTNESAVLNYTNYLGNVCSKTFPVPNMAWGDAMVTYEYYLVDNQGNPVNRDGAPVSFENRVTTYVGHAIVPLNTNGEYAALELNGYDYVPNAGYELFDKDPSFYVYISSAADGSVAYISDHSIPQTTLLTQGSYTQANFEYSSGASTRTYNYQASNVVNYRDMHICFAATKVDASVGLQITKNNTDGELLAGAGFGVYSDPECTTLAEGVSLDEQGQHAIATAVETDLYTGENGTISFHGLKANTTYYLKEFRTPAGYEICNNVLKLEIDETGQALLSNGGSSWTLSAQDNGFIKITLTDQVVDINLPLTSGVGVYGYMLAGLVLMGVATVCIVRLRKRKAVVGK